MYEAPQPADNVAIISAGEIVAEGPPSSLVGGDQATAIVRFRLPGDGDRLPDLLAREATVEGGWLEIRTPHPTRALHDLTGSALDRGIPLEELSVTRPSLEDVYLELTKDAAALGAE